MPLTLIGTLNEDGSGTSYGAYSLVFPYYIAGKDYYAMLLECRNTSNTAKGNQLLTYYIENIIKSIGFFYTFCLFYGIILVRRYGDIYV